VDDGAVFDDLPSSSGRNARDDPQGQVHNCNRRNPGAEHSHHDAGSVALRKVEAPVTSASARAAPIPVPISMRMISLVEVTSGLEIKRKCHSGDSRQKPQREIALRLRATTADCATKFSAALQL
jgi:hypothetical protein